VKFQLNTLNEVVLDGRTTNIHIEQAHSGTIVRVNARIIKPVPFAPRNHFCAGHELKQIHMPRQRYTFSTEQGQEEFLADFMKSDGMSMLCVG
jgi:hypothetical protein